jgi:adenylate kinase
MNLIFVGPQGSGKGTQAKIISEKFNLCHISTGDLLRNAQGELKQQIDEIMNQGKLVSDDLVIKLLKQKLNSDECKNGFILDGFPRNIQQAEQLDKIIKINKVIEIHISDKEAINRIVNRISCSSCGTAYNLKTNPPKQEMICDKCGTQLKKRQDDNKESLKKRLEIYHNETEPILKHYNSVRINGEDNINEITQQIIKAIQ